MVHSYDFGVVTAPHRLSKKFELTAKGQLKKKVGGSLSHGEWRHRRQPMSGLLNLLPELNSNQAMTLGLVKNLGGRRQVDLTSSKFQGEHPEAVARTRSNFEWADRPGLLLLDYDPYPGSDPLSLGALRDILCHTVPELHQAPMLAQSSASSWIYHGDQCLKGASGIHLFVGLADAREIPRFGKLIFDRLWLAGHGRILASKSGAALVRSLIDNSVWQPERLSFDGGAACGPELTQRRGSPLGWNLEAEPLDTSALPDLTPKEAGKLAEMLKAAKLEMIPALQKAENSWIESVGLHVLPKIADSEKALTLLREANRERCLHPGFVLRMASGESLDVADILRDPQRFDQQRCSDPLEPEYGSDPRIGIIRITKDRGVTLFSHAHGGRLFRLLTT